MSDIRDKRELRGEATLLTATFYRIFTAPEGTLNIELKVTINNPPIANANGPYTGVIEYIAVPILFDGTGSYASDPDGTIISYNWVLDDDGKFDDAVGATPTVSFTAPSTGNIQAVKLVLRTHR